jgi:hypothetical protein
LFILSQFLFGRTITVEESSNYIDIIYTQPQNNITIDIRVLALQKNKLLINNNNRDLSDSNPEYNNNNNKYSSENKLGYSSISKQNQ